MSQTTTPVTGPRRFSKKPHTSYIQDDLVKRRIEFVNAIHAFAEDPDVQAVSQGSTVPVDAEKPSLLSHIQTIVEGLAASENINPKLGVAISDTLQDLAARDPGLQTIDRESVGAFLVAASHSQSKTQGHHIKGFKQNLRQAVADLPVESALKPILTTLHEAAERSGLLVAIDHLLKQPERTVTK